MPKKQNRQSPARVWYLSRSVLFALIAGATGLLAIAGAIFQERSAKVVGPYGSVELGEPKNKENGASSPAIAPSSSISTQGKNSPVLIGGGSVSIVERAAASAARVP